MSRTPAPMVNWAGNVTFGARRVHRPTSVDELRRTVAGSSRIRAIGTAHSFSLVADTDADVVRLDRMPRTLEIDPVNSTVTVAAGMSYAEVAEALHRAGFALANMASLPHISVAGSCATGTHGSGDTLRCLAAAVSGLLLVGAQGELTELHRDEDPETFAGSVVALGALGVVARLTLDIEPTYPVAQRVRVAVGLDEVAANLDDVFGAAYSVSVFTDWLGDAVVFLKRRLDRADTGWAGGRPALMPLHPVPGMPADFSTAQLDVPGPWHERLPHFRRDFMPGAGNELQSEFYVPRERAPAAIAAIGDISTQVAPVLHIAELRSVRADDLWLSPAYGRDCVTFHFTWIDDAAAVYPVLRAVEQKLMPLGALPHWAKLTTVAAPDIAARYERTADFRKLVESVDPGGTFRNRFVDDLLFGG